MNKQTKTYSITLDVIDDATIISHLDSMENTQIYIKGLILANMYVERLPIKKSDYHSDYQTMIENAEK